MSLPFLPPPQLLAVDDVLPVEIIGDADTAFQDAREHFAREHFAGSGDQDAKHRVVTVPKAIALLTLDGGRWAERFSSGFESGPTWAPWPVGRPPLNAGAKFEFIVAPPWYGIGISARTDNLELATGWGRAQRRSGAGAIFHSSAAALTGICIAVFGEK